MPSFLSKVFGRKKDGKGSPTSRGRGSDGSLLDGKFEAVSQPASPIVTDFPENAPKVNGKEKEKEKDGALGGLFKVKSRPSRPSSPEPSKKENIPQLSLALPVPKEDAQARALGVVFEGDPDAQILSDEAIGNRRLTPLEALILIRTCSQAIIARGLETLGLMHPHWYSASPEVQRKLISLFIHSLNVNNAITTLSPSSSSPTSIFESEINYTRSPHDVAAVLRWGLRHLELEGKKFGKEESWYKAFAEGERSSEYPPKAFSEKLIPLIPPTHFELLNATLDLFSSLAAHSEKNSTSAGKLSRAFGLWLLAAQRVGENDDWPKFYARWKDNGRILEHLFLSRIRDESLRLRMPTRLTELVAHYPYSKGATTDDDVFLQPRVATRQFDALFVRVETEFSSPREKVHRHPLQFLKDAFAADADVQGNDCSVAWEKIRKSGSDENGVSPGGYPGLSRVFADETIRYLTLIPGDHPLKKATSPNFSIVELAQETPASRRYASSPGESTDGHSKAVNGNAPTTNGTTNGHVKPASEPSPLPSAISSSLSPDWAQFSSAGFTDVSPTAAVLASTLFGQDVEKTNPPFRKSSRRSRVGSPGPSRSPSRGATRKSSDHDAVPPVPPLPASITANARTSNVSQRSELPKLVSKSFPVSLVQIDEAFIEFWIDALLDPISSTWPKFVLCKLRSSLTDLTVDEKQVQYLVVEHVFVPKPPSPTPAPAELPQTTTAAGGANAEPTTTTSPQKSATSSPRSARSERRLFGFFTSSGRNSFYGGGGSSSGKKRASSQVKVNELGEVIEESKEKEKEKSVSTVKLRIPSPKPRKSVDASRKSLDVRKSTEVSKQDVEKVAEKAENKEEEAQEKAAKEKEEKVGSDSKAAITAVGAVASVGAAAATMAVLADATSTTEETKEVVPLVDATDQAEPVDAAQETAQAPEAQETSRFVEVLPTTEPTNEAASEATLAPIAEVPGEAVPADVSVPAEEAKAEQEPVAAATNDHAPPVIATSADEPSSEAPVAEASEPVIAVDESATAAAVADMRILAATAPEPEVKQDDEAPVPQEEPLAEPTVEVPAAAEPSAPEDTVLEAPVAASEPASEEPAVTETSIAVEEATVEEPVVEEPIVEAPTVVEEPPVEATIAVEEPVVEQPPVVEESAVEAPTAAEEPAVVDEVVVETLEAREPSVETPAAVEEPVTEAPSTVQETVVDAPAPAEELPVGTSAPLVEESDPLVKDPVVAEEPAVEAPAAVEEPPAEAPATVEAPVVEVPPAVEEHVEVPAPAEEPVVETSTSIVEESEPVVEAPAVVEEPTVEAPTAVEEPTLESITDVEEPIVKGDAAVEPVAIAEEPTPEEEADKTSVAAPEKDAPHVEVDQVPDEEAAEEDSAAPVEAVTEPTVHDVEVSLVETPTVGVPAESVASEVQAAPSVAVEQEPVADVTVEEPANEPVNEPVVEAHETATAEVPASTIEHSVGEPHVVIAEVDTEPVAEDPALIEETAPIVEETTVTQEAALPIEESPAVEETIAPAVEEAQDVTVFEEPAVEAPQTGDAPAPLVESTPVHNESAPVEEPAVTEDVTPVPQHHVEETVATAHERPSSIAVVPETEAIPASTEIAGDEAAPEVQVAVANGNGHQATDTEKEPEDEVIPTENVEDEPEAPSSPKVSADSTLPSEPVPEFRPVVEDD